MTPGHTIGIAPILPLNLLHVTAVRLRSGFFRVYSAYCAATVRFGAIILSLLLHLAMILILKDINLQKLFFVCQNVTPSPQNTAFILPARTQPNQHNHLYLYHLYNHPLLGTAPALVIAKGKNGSSSVAEWALNGATPLCPPPSRLFARGRLFALVFFTRRARAPISDQSVLARNIGSASVFNCAGGGIRR